MTSPTSPDRAPVADHLEIGRGAFARHAWQEAFEALSAAEAEHPLPGADLESLSEAAFFSAHADNEVEAKERAFKAYVAEGNQLRAAYVAVDLARRSSQIGKPSIASAWAKRAERLVDGQPEGYVHGYLALVGSDVARASGDIETAVKLAERAVEIAGRGTDADLQAWALTALGTLKIGTGATTDGFALMEEAAIAAVNGELSTMTTGMTCCQMIAACRDLTDYRRASEWTEATERWCERQSVAGFPGICRIHRAEVVAISGAWERAERELRQATVELAGYNAVPPLADGLYAIGEIRRLQGDYEGAEATLREAHSYGRTPQPGLALIRLAQGKVKAAATAINTAVAEETWDQWARLRLLPAQIEIAIAAGDVPLARTAADELGRIVDSYYSPALAAGRHQAFGRVLLAEGDPAAAAQELRNAIREWREAVVPYEVARTRAVLSKAVRALGDEDSADLELQAARTEFERLGAKPDAALAERELRVAADRRSAPTQIRRTFMFTDIVGSTRLAEALGDDSWERILRWHDDKIRELARKSGGEVVNSTGDGFFVAFESAASAIECARSIQQTLTDHRDESGFALTVRIGLHTAEANRRGDDYSGMGVHVAARVTALAEAGQILATSDTLAEAGDARTVDPREAEVKGVTAPVAVASVVWA
jgi:class 3 adenylate cyclase